MTDDSVFEAYVQSHGARVPEAWRLWWDEQGRHLLIISLDENGQERGHMIDDEEFSKGLADYLRARGVKILGE
jgi:hypothetical protein